MNNIIEFLRWAGVSVGVFLAFNNPGHPIEQFNVLYIWVTVSVAGLTGLESLFFGSKAAEQSGYGGSGAYQRQSGLNNLALGITAVLVYVFAWGVQAKSAIMMALLIFLALSAANHAYSAYREGNRSRKNLLRPVLTGLLLAAVLPFMIRALTHQPG